MCLHLQQASGYIFMTFWRPLSGEVTTDFRPARSIRGGAMVISSYKNHLTRAEIGVRGGSPKYKRSKRVLIFSFAPTKVIIFWMHCMVMICLCMFLQDDCGIKLLRGVELYRPAASAKDVFACSRYSILVGGWVRVRTSSGAQIIMRKSSSAWSEQYALMYSCLQGLFSYRVKTTEQQHPRF